MRPSRRPLVLHPDRLLPSDPATRAIARRVLDEIRGLPIISPHGHVDARLLLDDLPFTDPTSLLVTPDHYVTRLLHASGVPLGELGVGRGPLGEDEARAAWRLLCAHWDVYLGTPVRSWLEAELVEVFGVSVVPDVATADEIYDAIAACLALPDFTPRSLYARFGIEVLATTDDPTDDLASHSALRADAAWTGRVIPTFRPDRYLEAGSGTWVDDVARLGAVTGEDTGTYRGWVAAMEARRAYFLAHGARSTDHSHEDVGTAPLLGADAERIYASALRAEVSAAECTALRRHMLLEMARMATEDGLTMTLHPGVRRNHHGPTLHEFGPDTGHDIPLRVEFTDALRPLLERFGTHPNLRLVLFTLDESSVLAGDRTARRLLPLGVRRSAVVVPRRARCRTPLAVGRHRHRRALPHVGLRRRHPRVLLHPRPPRHVAAARQRLPRRSRRRAPDDGGRRGARRDRSRHGPTARGVRAVSLLRALTTTTARSAGCTSDSAASSAPTRRGSPRPRWTDPSGASPRSPAAARSWQRRSSGRTASTCSTSGTLAVTATRSSSRW